MTPACRYSIATLGPLASVERTAVNIARRRADPSCAFSRIWFILFPTSLLQHGKSHRENQGGKATVKRARGTVDLYSQIGWHAQRSCIHIRSHRRQPDEHLWTVGTIRRW